MHINKIQITDKFWKKDSKWRHKGALKVFVSHHSLKAMSVISILLFYMVFHNFNKVFKNNEALET